MGFDIKSGSYLNRNNFSAYIAADADKNGKITAGDFTLINHRAVQIIRHFPNHNSDWVGIPDSLARILERQQFDADNLPQISSTGIEKLELASPTQICQQAKMLL
ncbi:MAG: hypothetical protein U5L45_26910 [Saprospiraceae bacterium]|nr:hypothetical protein [Saprospiraceae bacterium]